MKLKADAGLEKRLTEKHTKIHRHLVYVRHIKNSHLLSFLAHKGQLVALHCSRNRNVNFILAFYQRYPTKEHEGCSESKASPSLQEGRGDLDLPAKQAFHQNSSFILSLLQNKVSVAEGDSSPWVQLSRETLEVQLVQWVRLVPEKEERENDET